ncbi:MAG: hypothetical protein ABL962_14975, partial [Fimbriimonadaceae bacterium]
FSKWEGYNLGIAEALAMGLPVVASDIPAHRAFGLVTSDDLDEITQMVADFQLQASSGGGLIREPRLWRWENSLQKLQTLVEEL